ALSRFLSCLSEISMNATFELPVQRVEQAWRLVTGAESCSRMRTRSECFPPLVPPEPGTTHAQVFIMPIARKLRPWVYLSGLAAFGSAACGSSDARPPLAETDPTP